MISQLNHDKSKVAEDVKAALNAHAKQDYDAAIDDSITTPASPTGKIPVFSK